jgi:hypothetical protein
MFHKFYLANQAILKPGREKMKRRLLALCILVLFLVASFAFAVRPVGAILPGQTLNYNVSANDSSDVASGGATLSYYTSGSDEYVRVDLYWGNVWWYPSIAMMWFNIGKEFTIVQTNCPNMDSHVSLPWHTGWLWWLLGIPSYAEGSRITDVTQLPAYYASYYFIAKRVDYTSTTCSTEMGVMCYTGGPEHGDDISFQTLNLPLGKYVSSIYSQGHSSGGAVNNPNNLIGNGNDGQYTHLHASNNGDYAWIVGKMNAATSGHVYAYGYSQIGSNGGYVSHLVVSVSSDGNTWTTLKDQMINPTSGPSNIDCGSTSNSFNYIKFYVDYHNGYSAGLNLDAVHVLSS